MMVTGLPLTWWRAEREVDPHEVNVFCMVAPLLLVAGVPLRDPLIEAVVDKDLEHHTVPDEVTEDDLWHGVAHSCLDTGSGVNTGMFLTAVMQYAVSKLLVIALQ
jgi:hypothetical protein